MRKIFSIGALLLASYGVFAQSETERITLSEYNNNPFFINEAYAGLATENLVSASAQAFYNNNVEGSPKIFRLSGVVPFKSKNFGIGLNLISEKLGTQSNNTARIAYAYRLQLSEPSEEGGSSQVISLAVTGGVNFFSDDLASLGILNDSRLSKNQSTIVPTVGASAVYSYERLFVGVSVSNLVGDTWATNEKVLKLSYPWYAYAGYGIALTSSQKWILQPSVMMKYDAVNYNQWDFNGTLYYDNAYEIGVGYRTGYFESVQASVGAKIKSLKVHYGYNHHLGETNHFKGIHSLSLGFAF